MAITVLDGASGSKIEFPDGTPHETIQQVMRGFAQKQQPSAPSAPKEPFGPTRADAFQGAVTDVRASLASLPAESRNAALKEWAKTRVQRERAAPGGKGDDGVYRFAAGTPIGSWLDEGEAALQGGLHKISGGRSGAPYDEALAYERAKMEAIDADSKKLGSVTLPFVGDVGIYSGGLSKLAGGLASAPLAPMAHLMRGTTMLPSMVNAAATGAGYGAVYGAGEGETVGERGFNAAVGGGLGAGLGGAAAPIARGIGRLITPDPALPGNLTGMNRKGVGFLADDARADNLTAQRTAAEAARMGPEATLADMGNNVRTTAGAIARSSGEGRATVVDTLGRTVRDGRRGGADARIQQELNAALGNPVDTVALERQVVQQANTAARPFYQSFERKVIPASPAIRRLEERLRAAGAMGQADKLMTAEAFKAPLVRTGSHWQTFASEMRDVAERAASITSKRELDAFRNSLGRASEVTDNLRAGAMFDDFKTQAQELLAKASGVTDKAGLDSFVKSAKTMAGHVDRAAAERVRTGKQFDYYKRAVDDLAREAKPGSNEERILKDLSKSTRNTVDLILNRKNGSSDWKQARDLAAVGQQFRSGVEEGRGAFSKAVTADQMRFDVGRMRPGERQGFQVGARDSIRQAADNASTMFGATGDASTMRMLNAPAAQDKLQQLVGPQAAQRVGNRLNTEADFELTRQAAVGNSVTAEMTAAQRRMGVNTATPQAETVTGMVKAAAKWATDKMIGGYRDERMRRMTGDMARVLMAQGGERDAIIRDLQTLIAAQGTRGTQRTIAEGVLKAMSDASRPLAIEQATR